jgi:hypothetical protein
MKIYVNGDSHAAAAEAVNAHAFAEDDGQYFYMGRAPHPENAAVGWPATLGRLVKATVHNDSESASSNHRIRRTTRDWIRANERWLAETVIMISWSTWERQEWQRDGQVYQVNASGQDHVHPEDRDRYREFIANIDWQQCCEQEHGLIWQLHCELRDLGVRHVFFNGNNHFADIPQSLRQDWGTAYIQPYDAQNTYDSWLKRNGFRTVSPNSWHFGADAHAAWAGFLLQYGIQHGFWR